MLTVSFPRNPNLLLRSSLRERFSVFRLSRHIQITCLYSRPIRITTTTKKTSLETMPTSASSASKIVAEYAKSNRSSCKICSNTIAAKTLRLGLVTRDPRGFEATKWHHLGCFPIDSESTGPAEDIGGFSSLQNDDQVALNNLLQQCRKKLSEEQTDEDNVEKGLDEMTPEKRKQSQKEEEDNDQTELDEKSAKKIKVTMSPSSSSSKIIAEYAKSNRSSCKKCSKTITAKALRLGLVTRDSRGFDMTKWYHFDCFPIHLEPIDNVEEIGGFSSLQNEDQFALKKLVQQSGKPSEESTAPQIEAQLNISFSVSDIKEKYKDAKLLPKWKAFQTIIFLEGDDGLHSSKKIAAFDFDGCLAKTDVRRVGAASWSLMYPSIPEKLQNLYSQGYKLVVFTNESNIDRWKNKRQVAVDSKLGRLDNFINRVGVPIQVFIACGFDSSDGKEDPFRKPKTGMWQIMKEHFNSGISIDMDQSFYVGDAAGRSDDHSDADIKFAQAIGLRFNVPEEYFAP